MIDQDKSPNFIFISTAKWAILVFLTFVSTTLLSQSSLQSRIDFKVIDLPVEDVLLQLSEVANIGILFSANLFSESQIVTLKLKTNLLKMF
ncbi:MAG: hypothetical protein ACI9XO_002555 [Paraglaciecola sp.]|jgi:hypothetical protein